MKLVLSERAIGARAGPTGRSESLEKQLRYLLHNLHHSSLHAKKYDEACDIWQARINRSWRFYFQISGDTYVITGIIPHPK